MPNTSVKNIGKIEAYLRMIMAVTLIAWVFMQPSFGLAEGIATIVAFCFSYNFLFSHCYGWQWLGISTFSRGANCPAKKTSGAPQD